MLNIVVLDHWQIDKGEEECDEDGLLQKKDGCYDCNLSHWTPQTSKLKVCDDEGKGSTATRDPDIFRSFRVANDNWGLVDQTLLIILLLVVLLMMVKS